MDQQTTQRKERHSTLNRGRIPNADAALEEKGTGSARYADIADGSIDDSTAGARIPSRTCLHRSRFLLSQGPRGDSRPSGERPEDQTGMEGVEDDSDLAGRRPLPPGALASDPSLDVTEHELERELALELDRLTAASASLSSARRWVEQYTDEATALAALTQSAAEPGQGQGPEAVISHNTTEQDEPRAVQSIGGPSMRGRRVASPARASTASRHGREHAQPEGDQDMGWEGGQSLSEELNRDLRVEQPGPVSTEPPTEKPEPLGATSDSDREAGALDQRETKNAEGHDAVRSARRLEEELRQVREELNRVREKATYQTRMYGSIGSQSRKLDRQAVDLRDRVTRAQKALDERAEKLRAALVKERDRLKAYHAKLRDKAKDLMESARAEKRRQAEDDAARKSQIEATRAELQQREAELESRRAELEAGVEARRVEIEEAGERALERRRAELEEAAEDRESEIKQAWMAREEEFDSKEAALTERESALAARGIALTEREEAQRQSQASKEAELREKAEELRNQAESLEEQARIEREEVAEERKALQAESAAAAKREADVENLRSLINEREATVAERDRHVADMQDALSQREDAATKRSADLDSRDEELSRISEAMEVRENRLREWQARIENTETAHETQRLQVEQQQRTLELAEERNRDHASELEAESLEIQKDRENLKQERVRLDSRAVEIDQETIALQMHAEENRRRASELDEQAVRLAEEREKYARNEARTEELDHRDSGLDSREADLDGREKALDESVASYEQKVSVLERSREEMGALRSRLDAERQELETRDAAIDERMQQVGEREAEVEERIKLSEKRIRQGWRLKQQLKQLKAERAQERTELDKLQVACDEKAEALREREHEQSRRQEMLDAAEVASELDREKLVEQQDALTQERIELERRHQQLDTELASLEESRGKLAEEAADMARQRQNDADQRTALEADRAKLESEVVGLRDRERVLEEDRSRLAEEQNKAEQIREDLARQKQEAETAREALENEIERQYARKRQQEEDAAKVETDREAVDAELAAVRQQRLETSKNQTQLDEDRKVLEGEREEFDLAREELKQSQRTYQAGLRSLEENEKELVEREAKLAERAHQLETYRGRLEDEYTELQNQREALLAAQDEKGEGADQVSTLMRQVEEREQELRKREDGLHAHEQALSARAAELAKAEEDVHRGGEEHEERVRKSSADLEALVQQRKALEAEIESQHAEVRQQRDAAAAEIAAEREALAQRRRELEEETAAQRAAMAAEETTFDRAATEDARRKAEEALADHFADVEKKEVETDRRCESRIEEVERDISRQLSELEAEIKTRREQAGREITERRESLEDEMAKARGRLDEQIEELRHRQAMVAEEQALLNERCREFEDQLPEMARRPEPADDRLDEDTPGGEEPVMSGGGRSDWQSNPDVAGHEGAGAAVGRHALSEHDPDVLEDSSVVPDLENLGGIGAEPQPSATGAAVGVLPAGSGHAAWFHGLSRRLHHAWQASVAPGEQRHEITRKFRPVWAGIRGLLLGGLAAMVYLWSPSNEVTVRCRLTLNPANSGATITAEHHIAGLIRPAVFEAASRQAGVELRPLYRAGDIQIVPSQSGDYVELTATAPVGESATVQGWIDSLALTYEASLGLTEMSEEQRRNHLSDLKSKLDALQSERQTTQAALVEMEAALQADPRLGEIEASRHHKVALAAKVAEALDTVNEAKSALAKLKAAGESTAPIVPSEAQLQQAYSSDVKLMQAVEQRDVKARDFHRVLTGAMSASETPLTSMLATLEGFCVEVKKQLAEQSDEAIRRELELVAFDLEDYRDNVMRFSREWDELAPKVAAWNVGCSPDVLIEYQQKAETLVRRLHKQSRNSLGATVNKTDAIGRGGSEMTKRRIIQSALMKLAHACDEARTKWIVSAWGVVPANHLELKALRGAILDLTPRIEERRQYHREKLVEHLAEARTDERAARMRQLEDQLAEATRQHQELSDQYLKVDSALSQSDEQLSAELERRREEIQKKREDITHFEKEETALSDQIELVRAADKVNLAGAVTYRSLEPLLPNRFNLDKSNGAVALGGAVALLFVFSVWLVSRTRQSSQEDSP